MSVLATSTSTRRPLATLTFKPESHREPNPATGRRKPKSPSSRSTEKFLFLCVFSFAIGIYHNGLNSPGDFFTKGTINWDGEVHLLTLPRSLPHNLTTNTSHTEPPTPAPKAAQYYKRKALVTVQEKLEHKVRESLKGKHSEYLKHVPRPDLVPFQPKTLAPASPTDPNQHAIVIPYRSRSFHLKQFIAFMNPYLRQHFPDHTFSLWVIEQGDEELFNRGWLTNVALRELHRLAPQTNCVILHDVDLLPNQTDTFVPYTSCEVPIHLSRNMEPFWWKIPYDRYCGGVTSLSLNHWLMINGMSNDYVGWGGEDDDLWHRLRINGLLEYPDPKRYPTPKRPPEGQGIFRAISQEKEHHVQIKDHNNSGTIQVLLKKMWRNSDRWKTEGYNDVFYTVLRNATITNHTNHSPIATTTTNFTGGFSAIQKIKVIPKRSQHPAASQVVLELLDIPYSGGHLVTRAAARSNIVWGACHYGNFTDHNCHYAQRSGDWRYEGMMHHKTYEQAKTPWYLSPHEWKHSPQEGATRFVVVRNPYQRAIDFYRTWYDRWNGTRSGEPDYIHQREQPDSLNQFLQKYLNQDSPVWKPEEYMRGVVEMMPQADATSLPETTDGSWGKEPVSHVLKYESLLEDFQNLIQSHPHYKIQEEDMALLATELTKAKQTSGTLHAGDLTPNTIVLINEIYQEDFRNWQYERLPAFGDAKGAIHPRKKRHRIVKGKALLEYVPIPFSGMDEDITRAGSRAGLVWGACHFDQFEKYECPTETSGDFGDTLKLVLPSVLALEPWNYPIKSWVHNPYRETKTFTVVINPYSRAILFYRRLYDRQHGHPNGFQVHAGQTATEYLMAREDRETMNRWLQEYFTKHHHPHRPDGIYLLPQYKLVGKLSFMPKAEILHDDFQKMFARLRTSNLEERAQRELLAVADSLLPKSPTDGKWLEITDLSDVSVAMINEIYEYDFFKFYPGMKMDTNATTASFWEKIIPIPQIKGGASPLKTRKAVYTAERTKRQPSTTRNAQVDPSTAAEAAGSLASLSKGRATDPFQMQNNALASATDRLGRHRAGFVFGQPLIRKPLKKRQKSRT